MANNFEMVVEEMAKNGWTWMKVFEIGKNGLRWMPMEKVVKMDENR